MVFVCAINVSIKNHSVAAAVACDFECAQTKHSKMRCAARRNAMFMLDWALAWQWQTSNYLSTNTPRIVALWRCTRATCVVLELHLRCGRAFYFVCHTILYLNMTTTATHSCVWCVRRVCGYGMRCAMHNCVSWRAVLKNTRIHAHAAVWYILICARPAVYPKRHGRSGAHARIAAEREPRRHGRHDRPLFRSGRGRGRGSAHNETHIARLMVLNGYIFQLNAR